MFAARSLGNKVGIPNVVSATVLILSFALMSAAFCSAEKNNKEILISAAVSLKDAFEEIGAIYEKQTKVQVRFNFGSSGLLQKQIETGAPVDVFASAGAKQMDALQARRLIDSKTRRNFAGNTLVLVVPAHSKILLRSFSDLARPEVMRVAIGNPKTVPAGQYGQEVLRNLNLLDKLQSRFVLAENVRQVLDYVVRGEVEAGIVYASDVEGARGKITVAAHAPKGSNASIQYPIAVVIGTAKQIDARRFIDLTLSDRGQTILKKYGFLGFQ